jgi:HEAT repeats
MPDKLKEFINDLSNTNGIIRQKARYELVKIGNPALDDLLKLQNSEMHIARWEAIKAVSEIGTKDSIPILITALEDDEFDIRWLASEGLIEIGHNTIFPLLKAFVSNKDSIHLKESLHHVLKGLELRGLYSDKAGIIKALENFTTPVKLQLIALNILNDELAGAA